MKTLKLIALAACPLLLSQCKTTAPTAPTATGSSVVQVLRTLDTVQSKFYDLGNANLGSTPGQVMLQTASWLKTQSNVQSVGVIDSLNLDIVLKSGLHTIFSIGIVGSDSLSLSRGGDHPTNVVKFSVSTQSNNTIINKKILFYSPMIFPNGCEACLYHQDEINLLVNRVKNAGSDFTATVNTGSSLNDVLSFPNYGIVFIDTHGLPFGFYSGIQFTRPSEEYDSTTNTYNLNYSDADLKSVMDSKLGAGMYDKILSGSFYFGYSAQFYNWQQFLKPKKSYYSGKPYTLIIGSKYILNEMPLLPATVIFGNFCYSGWTKSGPSYFAGRYFDPITIDNPIQTAFMSKQPISYYSYGFLDGTSNPVGDIFSKAMEDTLISRLLVKLDSTGNAYKNASGGNFIDQNYQGDILFHSGADDYSYATCGEPLTDARDGQVYKTVCIGTQQWMAQNLNYDAPGSRCYEDNSANCDLYGKMYTWPTLMAGASSSNANPSGVQGICPKGWHVPSLSEWQQLILALGSAQVAGGAMKDTILWKASNMPGNNSSGFSALPAGAGILSNSVPFGGLGVEATFGISTIQTGNQVYWVYISFDSVGIQTATGGSQDLITSCRCVKDP